jgi:hypothetical protein
MTAKKAVTSKTKAKKAPAKKAAPKDQAGYAGHRPESRKGAVHEAFDKQGEEAAKALGLKLGLKDGTLRSWLGTWKRAA